MAGCAVQKYDWMKHLTDAEMQQMKADNWDVEDVELGPITDRYLQPSLQFDPEEYAKVISQGREASRLIDLYNNGGNVRAPPALLPLCLLSAPSRRMIFVGPPVLNCPPQGAYNTGITQCLNNLYLYWCALPQLHASLCMYCFTCSCRVDAFLVCFWFL